MRNAHGHEDEPAGTTPIDGQGSAADDGSAFTPEEKQALKDYVKNHEAINAALKEGRLAPRDDEAGIDRIARDASPNE
jgi:hypothetical protein